MATVTLSPATKPVGKDCACATMGAAASAPADAVVEAGGDCVATDKVDVGRVSGMLVGAVGRFVMKGCVAGIPATTTEVGVLIWVTVLGSGVGNGAKGGEGGKGGEATSVLIVAELIRTTGIALSLVVGVVDVVDVAAPAPGMKGVTRLFRPLIPSHMIFSGSVHLSGISDSCHRLFDHTKILKSSLTRNN